MIGAENLIALVYTVVRGLQRFVIVSQEFGGLFAFERGRVECLCAVLQDESTIFELLRVVCVNVLLVVMLLYILVYLSRQSLFTTG